MTDPLHQRLRAAADALTHEPVALSQLADLHGHGTRGALLVLLRNPRREGATADDSRG